MNPQDPNIQILQTVSQALGDLRNDLVFVGGCAAGLLITDEARPAVRSTNDVDLIAEVLSQVDYYKLGAQLKLKGFTEDPGSIICRWRLGGVSVDVMPIEASVLSFSNRWYPAAMETAQPVELPNGNRIRLIDAPHFVATKIEAFHGRGNGNFQSHDLEDIINVVDGRPSLVEEVGRQQDMLREYLREELEELLSNDGFLDSMPAHLRPSDQGRIEIILARMRAMAGL